MAAVVLGLALAAPARAETETLYGRLLKSTGWINCPQPGGANSSGTCWVFDAQERLVITNHHVVDGATKVVVDFPMYQNGQLVKRVSEYQKCRPFRGKVLATDVKRDLALCQLEALPKDIVALPMAGRSTTRGQLIFSLGNSSASNPNRDEAALWRMASGKVDFRYFEVVTIPKPHNHKVEVNTVRGTLPTAGGDSGGPVVNTRGELVGVNSSADRSNSFSIDVEEVRTFVARVTAARAAPPKKCDVVGTWTVATTDELGRCFWSLTVRSDGTCLMERDEGFEGTLRPNDRGDSARLAIPGLSLQGDVMLTWSGDDEFSFTCGGKDFSAVRR
jgi:hypothetical protein